MSYIAHNGWGFSYHTQKSTQNEHLHPEETLTEILSDNRRLLERQLRPRLIHKSVNLLRRGRDEKYAKLIATLCTCEGHHSQPKHHMRYYRLGPSFH